MSEQKPNKLFIAFIVVIALVFALEIVSIVLSQIDVSTLPPELVGVVGILQYIFLAAPIAVGLGFARNLTGYAIAKLREARKENPKEIDYSMKWLGQTLVTFNGWVLIATPFIDQFITTLPVEHKAVAATIAASVLAMIDLFLSEVKHTVTEVKK